MCESTPSTLEHQLTLYKGLVEVSVLINRITDYEHLLDEIMRVAIRVMEAEAGSLMLVDKATGELEMTVALTRSRDLEKMRLRIPRGQGIAGWVFEHGSGLLIKDAYSDPRFYKEMDLKTGFRTRSILCVPLLSAGMTQGVLQILNPTGKHAFNQDDLSAFEAYASLAATAIEKLHNVENERLQMRLDQELELATDIQKSFLPSKLPHHDKVSFASHYRPARRVGGDFFDIVQTGPEEFYFTVGDVAGKGVPAALLMAQSLSVFREVLTPGISTGDLLSHWNSRMHARVIRGIFITAMAGKIDTSTREVEIASAGHCPPVWIAKGGVASEVRVKGAPPLGILPGMNYVPQTLKTPAGSFLLAYTDGLSESEDVDGVFLDRAGIVGLASAGYGSADSLAAGIAREEARHRGAAEPQDDLTLLAICFS